MNGVVHFEIPADNVDRAETFYKEAFGWEIQRWDNPEGMIYSMAMTTPVGENMRPTEPGSINGAICPRNPVQGTPVLVLAVEGIEDALLKVKEAGGEAVVGPMPVSDVGIYALFKDTENNLLGLWQNLTPCSANPD
ncbi:MAG: VOC family protein [Armatimonadetes bacterium]|nr:VOC family protein [Armatimonadota bacterium]